MTLPPQRSMRPKPSSAGKWPRGRSSAPENAERGRAASGVGTSSLGSPEGGQRARTSRAKKLDKGRRVITSKNSSFRTAVAEARDDEVQSDLRRTDRVGDRRSNGSRPAASPNSSSVPSGPARVKTRPRSVTPTRRLSQRQGRSLDSGGKDRDGTNNFGHAALYRPRYRINSRGGDDEEIRQALEHMVKVKSSRARPSRALESSARRTRDAETREAASAPAVAAIIKDVSLADCLHDETRSGRRRFLSMRPLLPTRPVNTEQTERRVGS